jgi:hypothetical protein
VFSTAITRLCENWSTGPKVEIGGAAQPQADPIPGGNYAEINNAALHNFI